MNIAARLVVLSLVFMVSHITHAASMMDGFTDPKDGMFDVSHYLADKKGFFPMPVIITEPAVGYGAGAALIFLHDPLAGRLPEEESYNPQGNAEGKLVPPSISALFGAYTENDTWFAGGGHMGVWKDDNIRYTGAIGTGSINMKFYGLGQSKNASVDFNIEPEILFQRLKFRLKGSKFFAGIDYLYLDTESEFNASRLLPGLVVANKNTDAAIGFSLEFDNRDTIFTPNSGMSAELATRLFRESVGGDSDYEKYRARVFWFTPLSSDFVLGLRGDFESVQGEFAAIPYYQYPFINIRGIPAMRYQGRNTAVAETELRWDFTYRWSTVLFAGVGRTDSVERLDNSENVTAGGAGLRYFIARRFGVRVGFDVAVGPEDTAFYLQFGQAWR